MHCSRYQTWEPTRLPFFVGVVLSVAMVACRTNPGDAQIDDCALQIGLVTGAEGINDGGMNEAGWAGIQEATRILGLQESCAIFLVARNEAEVTTFIRQLSEDGYDVVVTAGLGMGESTRAAGQQYPAMRFIGIGQPQRDADGRLDGIENVAGLTFREEVQGFMAGALAGLATESGIVGGVFGCEISPPVLRYSASFQNGVRYVNPDATVLVVGHPGSIDICYADPEYGATSARNLRDEGVDVVFTAGGKTADGALAEACELGAQAIGISWGTFEPPPPEGNCILAKLNLEVSDGVRDLVVAIERDAFVHGEFIGEVRMEASNDLPDAMLALERLQQQVAQGVIDPCAPAEDGQSCPPGT